MEGKMKKIFPKGFFTQPRPIISMEEALKDVVPFEWSNEVKTGKKKTIVISNK